MKVLVLDKIVSIYKQQFLEPRTSRYLNPSWNMKSDNQQKHYDLYTRHYQE
jgi:hypothetical protein